MPSVPQLEAAWQSGKGLRADTSLVNELKRSLDNVVELLRGGLSPHKSIIEVAAPALKLQAKWFCIDHDYAYARSLAFYSRTNTGKMIPPQGQQQKKKKKEEEEEEEEEVEICICREREEGFMLACDLCNEWFHANWSVFIRLVSLCPFITGNAINPPFYLLLQCWYTTQQNNNFTKVCVPLHCML